MRGIALACLLTFLLGPDRAHGQGSQGAPSSTEPLVVYAAASLKDVFRALAPVFAAQHAGAKVTFNFAGSQELRAQIELGAPADVLASADREHMAALEAAALVGPPQVFARNQLALVVPADNPAGLRAFADLPRATRLIVGAPEVPVGRYTERLLTAANSRLGPGFRGAVEAKIVSRELNVRQVLAKVVLGEVDAGIVYETDARAGGDKVRALPIPAELNLATDYPIAVVRASSRAGLAAAWVALVRSPAGQARLRAAGFLPPAVSARREGRVPPSSPAR